MNIIHGSMRPPLSLPILLTAIKCPCWVWMKIFCRGENYKNYYELLEMISAQKIAWTDAIVLTITVLFVT
jgi:hypothetical protein